MASNSNTKHQGGWNFNLDKVGNKESLKDPLGFKCPIQDIMVRSSGKTNLTQMEVLESVT